jgi:hypothetical protein
MEAMGSMMGVDPTGEVYDTTWLGADGTRCYQRNEALGTGGGPATWSDRHYRNGYCGCHLAAFCCGCNACMNCDGCRCHETMDLVW